jgi:ABC-2 type transport system permease protein
MRMALLEDRIAWGHLAAAIALNIAWIAIMWRVFMGQFERARETGALINIGE